MYGDALEMARSGGSLRIDLDEYFGVSDLHRSAAAFYRGQPGKAAEACRLQRAELDLWQGWSRLGGGRSLINESRLADAQAEVAMCGPENSSPSFR